MSRVQVHGAAVALGYDPSLLVRLREKHRRSLDALCQAWIFSCVLLGFPVGLTLWLIEHSLLLACGGAGAASFLVLNLLRLVHSGSGTAPEHPFRRSYRPSYWPPLLIGSLALMMSQPAQLLHAPPRVEQAVESHRANLIAAHLAAQEQIKDIEPGGTRRDVFLEELKSCEFVVLRLKLLWGAPEGAVMWTLLFVGLVLSPAAWGRVVLADSVLAYERVRHRRAVFQMRASYEETERAIVEQLSSYSSYRQPWPFPLNAPGKTRLASGAPHDRGGPVGPSESDEGGQS